MDNKLVHMMTF